MAVAGCHQGADGELYAVGVASGPAASAVQTGPTVGLQYGGMEQPDKLFHIAFPVLNPSMCS